MDRVEFVPGQALPLFELKPPVFEGVDFAIKRSFDLVFAAAAPDRAVAVDGVRRARDQAELAWAGALPFEAARHRRQVVRLLQVPDDGERGRAAAGGPRAAQRAERRHLQDPSRTRASRRSAASCGAGRSTSCPSSSTCCAARCRSSGPRPLPQRDYDRLEPWHRKRYLVLPGMTGLWQVSGRSELDFDEPRPARLPLPRALVGLPRPDHPAQDDPRGHPGAGRW